MTSLALTAAEVKMPDLLATGDAQAGAALVATCSACHGLKAKALTLTGPALQAKTKDT